MKLFAPALIFCGAASFGQSPQVPHKMQFAGMTLTIRDDARREIQKDVDALTLHPKYFDVKAERARTYFPVIGKIFAEERLPEDFKYLALQESALIPDAVSSSNAVGFWQFKDFTAQEMGLRVDDSVDERMNIASSSRAAARYLKQCNHYFNNWVYALQSYQMGAGGVMRAVGDANLGVRHMEITTDTYWYVKKFLSHKVAFGSVMDQKPRVEVTAVYAAAGKTLIEISRLTSSDEQQLRDFNKWLKTGYIPADKSYILLVPRGRTNIDFDVLATVAATAHTPVQVMASVPEETPEVNGVPAIRANRGETLEAIALRGNAGLSDFLHYNDMQIDQPLSPGQLYFLHKKKKRAHEELYTVQPGDDLWTISQQFGLQMKFLLKFNDLEESSNIPAGLTLYLNRHRPAVTEVKDEGAIAQLNEDDSFDWDLTVGRGTVKPEVLPELPAVKEGHSEETTEISADSSSTAMVIHEVKAADTLYSVARQYGVTIRELMDWNEKKDFSLSVGEKLKVRSH